MTLDLAQGEMFTQADLVLRPALLGSDGVSPFIAIGCGRHKRPQASPADKLYLSPRVKASLALARTLGAPHGILSGKHGLLAPGTIVEPYDLNVGSLSNSARRLWAGQVLQQLRTITSRRRITVLAEREYTLPLAELNGESDAPLNLEMPWLTLDRPDVSIWLAEANRMVARINDLKQLYKWIERARSAGRVFPLRNLPGQVIPPRGVYIFLDRREPNFLGVQPRIVRVGTHAVSRGSKATLRSRLRNHLGPASEIGNHRGSIFRLHVGHAMIASGSTRGLVPSWGEGQDAARHIKAMETDLELAVSLYLRELEVSVIPINDEPAKSSLRARVESQLIALCSEGLRPLDDPTFGWLGLKSPVAQIRTSGLWNIRGIGAKYDPNEIGSVSSILEA